MASKNAQRILDGLNDALAIAEGRAEHGSYRVHIPPDADVEDLRKRLGLTHEEFSARYRPTIGVARD
jgi:hypothetical protein